MVNVWIVEFVVEVFAMVYVPPEKYILPCTITVRATPPLPCAHVPAVMVKLPPIVTGVILKPAAPVDVHIKFPPIVETNAGLPLNTYTLELVSYVAVGKGPPLIL